MPDTTHRPVYHPIEQGYRPVAVEWQPTQKKWPRYATVAFVFVASGACWTAIILAVLAVAAVARG